MEQAVLTCTRSVVDKAIKSGVSRIYFGSETCHCLLPSRSDIDYLNEMKREQGVDFSIVTPYFFQSSMSKVDDLLAYVNKVAPMTEIVVNDWGCVYRIREKYKKLTLVLGRLLSRQRRGFFVFEGSKPVFLYDKKCDRANREYGMASILQNDYWMELVQNWGIRRLGLDNMFQGITVPKREGVVVDLYYPYIYLTSSSYCFAREEDVTVGDKRKTCVKGCLKSRIADFDVFGKTVCMFGNGQFYMNDVLNGAVLKKVDRLVKIEF